MNRKRNKIRSVTLNLVAFGIGLVAALVILEIILRIVNPFESRVKGEKIVLPANKKYIFSSHNLRGVDRKIIHTKNSIGFRGPELPGGGIEDWLSIIAVGGSTTECTYLSDNRDWPGVLYEHLKRDFNPVWLNNAGLDGHSVYGHTILLNDIIADLKPRLVLFLVGANDMGWVAPMEQTAAHIKGVLLFSSIEGFIKSAAAYSEVASLVLNLSRFLKARSRGLGHENLEIKSLPPVDYPGPDPGEFLDPHIHNYVPAFKRRLRVLIKKAREFKIEPVLITQPALYGEGIDPATGIDLRTVSAPGVWARLELYNRATREIGEETGVLTIDLARELQKNSDWFYDWHHYTNAGAREVAAVVYRYLKPYLAGKYGSFLRPGKE